MAGAKGKGGLKHQKYQKILADYFRNQGKVAVIEAFIGKNVDVLICDNDKTVAVEIQLTSTHCLQIVNDYDLGIDEVWIVCESARILNNIKSMVQDRLNKALFERTKFYLINELIPHNKEMVKIGDIN
ncbi:MAG: ATP-binding protein [Euryarchaeota archaeon]|nr:ATP-binding protein [Euryarchaeota archaeon]